MGQLNYLMFTSVDGYVANEQGGLEWTPNDEVNTYINELVAPIGTFLYGRRMYESMVFWETAESVPDLPPYLRDFTRLWQAASKIVYSRTLTGPRSARTTIEREFDPAAVRKLKAGATHDLTISGPEIAAQALQSGLVDEIQILVYPIVLGGGKRFFPDHVRLNLRPLEERRFANGVIALRYRVYNG